MHNAMSLGRRKFFIFLFLMMGTAALLWCITFGFYSVPYLHAKFHRLKEIECQSRRNASATDAIRLSSNNICPTAASQTAPQCAPGLKGVHPLSVDPPYGCRLLDIRRRCAERSIKPGSLRSERFKYDTKVPVILCELPKVASTTWQAVLLKLNGFEGDITKELIHKFSYQRFPLKTLARVSEEQARAMVKNQTTFMITRHPFERLVSAYYDKFSNRSTFNWYKRNLGIRIAKTQAPDFLHGIGIPLAVGGMDALQKSPQFTRIGKKEQDDVIAYRRVIQTGEISFQQFIRHVLSYQRGKTEHKMDIHWRPQVLLCQPCAIDYSFVMRFENLVDESNRLLEFVQRDRNTNVTFPGESRPFTQSKTTVDALRLISEADVNRLRNLYAEDFYVLGHDPYRVSEEQARAMVKNQTTFMITRHPFERLVSAYYDKFSNRSTFNWYKRNLGIRIAKTQAPDFLHGIGIPLAVGGMDALQKSPQFTRLGKKEQDDVIAYRRVIQTGEISFQQFIRHVLSYQRGKTEHKMDIHWRPQVLLCQPCAIDYSFVMRFENLVDESNRLLEFVQRDRNTNVTFPGESRPFTQSKTTVEALRLISEADVNRLRNLYAEDFYVLGHDPYRYSGKQ